MRIFILEDDAARIMWFGRRFQGHDVTQVDTCAAIDAFKPPYDLICLDHDLGGRQMEQHEDNGERFAVLIGEQCPDPVPGTRVLVHSFNPEGANRVGQIMERNGYTLIMVAPFGFREFKAFIDQTLCMDRLPADVRWPNGAPT